MNSGVSLPVVTVAFSKRLGIFINLGMRNTNLISTPKQKLFIIKLPLRKVKILHLINPTY
jgi:hypothetical protein